MDKDGEFYKSYGRPQFLLHLEDAFRNILQHLRYFIGFMYDNETVQIHAKPDAASSLSMNQSQAYAVSQVVYDNPNFQHYGVTRGRSASIRGPVGEGKKSTIMNIISII